MFIKCFNTNILYTLGKYLRSEFVFPNKSKWIAGQKVIYI